MRFVCNCVLSFCVNVCLYEHVFVSILIFASVLLHRCVVSCLWLCLYLHVCVCLCVFIWRFVCVCVCFCLGGDLLIPVYTCIYSAGKPETSSALPWSCIVPGCWGVGGGRRARTNHSPPGPSPTNHRPPNSGSEASPRPLGLPPALAQAPAVLPAHQLPYLRPNLGSVLDSNWL